MKATRLQTKRQPAPHSLFHRLQAQTVRRQRVAATATAGEAGDLTGDVPNVGVARALFVILGLHIVAVVGIFVHNRYFDGERAANEPPSVPSPGSSATVTLPKLADTDQPHVIVAGDTYERIASKYGILEDDLRRANDNMPLRAGRIVRIPPQRIVALEPAELTARRENGKMGDRGVVVPEANHSQAAGGGVDTSNAPRAAVVVKADAPATAAAAPKGKQGAAESNGKRYVVKDGDSLWRIAKNHHVTPERLMRANGISDPKRMRTGMSLVIPKP